MSTNMAQENRVIQRKGKERPRIWLKDPQHDANSTNSF